MRIMLITAMTAGLLTAGASAALAAPKCEGLDCYSSTKAVPAEVEGINQNNAPADDTKVLGVKTVRGGGATKPSGATLPFTGAEVTGLALAGALLVGGGTTLVVAGRRRNQEPTA